MSSRKKHKALNNLCRNISIASSYHSRKFIIRFVRSSDTWHTIYGMSRKKIYHIKCRKWGAHRVHLPLHVSAIYHRFFWVFETCDISKISKLWDIFKLLWYPFNIKDSASGDNCKISPAFQFKFKRNFLLFFLAVLIFKNLLCSLVTFLIRV